MPRATKSTEADEALSKQSLKAAVWYTVTKIAQEEELSLPFAASEHFVATLAEVVFQQALSLGKDLERFAKHAGRLTINADDVKLASRRNEPLYELLTTAAQQHGLTLAELRADTASSKAKGKQVKAPRLATAPPLVPKTTKKKTKDEAKEDKGKSAKAGAKSKGKGKERARDEEEEEAHADEDDEDQLEMSEPEVDLGGGFVKASTLKVSKHSKPTKRKASTIVADSDEEEADAGSDGSGAGGESGDESEEVGAKRRRGAKGDGKGSKRRKTAG
ncbi:kinetochore component CENP-S-domain-containing protein [Rhodotorula diobovata]|uniref:Kinetochore component CENP-S-domain-containing protein n=1 Tax=Rhodotorula diobovata TaxID=5288 RepID=A0A5C5FY83_9BASI|nr:kinetochore component CENP-S-domain-containing protein [Rhodotorula diobovata]